MKKLFTVLLIFVLIFPLLAKDDWPELSSDEWQRMSPFQLQQRLEAGANPNARGNWNVSALHYAVSSSSNPDLVQVLLNAGADVHAEANGGGAPLLFAAGANDNPNVIRVLLDAGANVNTTDYAGFTPFLAAARRNPNPAVLQLLLDAGADRYATAEEGMDALTYAKQSNASKAVVYFLRTILTDDFLVDDIQRIQYRDLVQLNGGTVLLRGEGKDSRIFSNRIDPYSIGRYEVTYELWYFVYQWAVKNGYRFEHAGQEGRRGTPGAVPSRARYKPVTGISWRDAIVWCNAYSEMDGYKPVYVGARGAILKDSRNAQQVDSATVYWQASGYRLPSEAEWQFAASDGNKHPDDHIAGDYSGRADNSRVVDQYAWSRYNSGGLAQPVGQLLPNRFGLYDMSGNVSEMCWDFFAEYPLGSGLNYSGPLVGSERVSRGGGFESPSLSFLQVGSRGIPSGRDPGRGSYDRGFRVARSIDFVK